MDQQPNVILLTVDALRADHVGYHGYERDTTPFLDDLARRAARFDTAISASSHTREALPALLSGEHPDVFAANGYRHATETIADRLSAAGYATAGFHSNPYVSRAYGYDSGFDTFDDDLTLGRNRFVALAQRALNKFVLQKGEYHVRAADLNERSLAWLDSLDGDQPFFLWNHYMDPHGPYNPPAGNTFAERELSNSEAHALYQKIINRPGEVTDDERRLLIDCYDSEIRYLDRQLEQFFGELETRGLSRDSLIIVTADHGDAFGEHGYYTHPRRLHESLLHVPLVVSPPGKSIEATVTDPVSTLDVVPTILEYANTPAEPLPGTPLVHRSGLPDRGDDDAVFASATGEDEHDGVRRFAARGTRWKAVIERRIESGETLDQRVYDLQQDPGEEEPLTPAEIDTGGLLENVRAFSVSRLNSVEEGADAGSTREQSAELDDRLQALGYK